MLMEGGSSFLDIRSLPPVGDATLLGLFPYQKKKTSRKPREGVWVWVRLAEGERDFELAIQAYRES